MDLRKEKKEKCFFFFFRFLSSNYISRPTQSSSMDEKTSHWLMEMQRKISIIYFQLRNY